MIRATRKWLSYNEFDGKFYCSICMAFSNVHSPYKDGIVLSSKQGTGQVAGHGSSRGHIMAGETYMQMDSSKILDMLLGREQALLRSTEVKKKSRAPQADR